MNDLEKDSQYEYWPSNLNEVWTVLALWLLYVTYLLIGQTEGRYELNCYCFVIFRSWLKVAELFFIFNLTRKFWNSLFHPNSDKHLIKNCVLGLSLNIRWCKLFGISHHKRTRKKISNITVVGTISLLCVKTWVALNWLPDITNYSYCLLDLVFVLENIYMYFLIGIHSMQGWKATIRHGVIRKRNTKRLQHTGNLFRKNLQLKDVC